MSLLRPLLGIAGSTAICYLLRLFGVSVYAALVVGAVLSLLPALVSLVRGNRPGGLEAFFTVLLFASFAISLLPGDERFLLAKDALVTGGVGFWFLASLRWSDQPLAYQFAKPMVEGAAGVAGGLGGGCGSASRGSAGCGAPPARCGQPARCSMPSRGS